MKRKNPDAVKRGARGGKMRAAAMTANERAAAASKAGSIGGRARSNSLTKEQRAAIARKAAAARWKTTPDASPAAAPTVTPEPPAVAVKRAKKRQEGPR